MPNPLAERLLPARLAFRQAWRAYTQAAFQQPAPTPLLGRVWGCNRSDTPFANEGRDAAAASHRLPAAAGVLDDSGPTTGSPHLKRQGGQVGPARSAPAAG